MNIPESLADIQEKIIKKEISLVQICQEYINRIKSSTSNAFIEVFEEEALSKAENASIILFSTVAVNQGMNFHASIASAKGAVEGLTKSLAAEFAGKIRVNCIAPSLTDTPLAQGILRNEDAIKRSNERHPSKRINTASDVAKTAEFLLQNNNITGQIIRVDGGMSTLKV